MKKNGNSTWRGGHRRPAACRRNYVRKKQSRRWGNNSPSIRTILRLKRICKDGTVRRLRRLICRNNLSDRDLQRVAGIRVWWNKRCQFLPLTVALQAKNLEVARELLRHGADFGEREYKTQQCPREFVPWEWRHFPEFQPPWLALGKYDLEQYRKSYNYPVNKGKFYNLHGVHPVEMDDYPMERPDLLKLMRYHEIPLATDAPDHPLRVVVQQRAANSFLQFHEKLERSEMKTELSCMEFLFPDEAEETLEAWSQYVVRQVDTEWDLGVWPGPVAQGFVNTADACWRQFDGGARGIVGPGFRTVWPSAWRFVETPSSLEAEICTRSYRCAVFVVLKMGASLTRPEVLASEGFYQAPELVRLIVCRFAVPPEHRREYLEWLRGEDAHPLVLESMEQSFQSPDSEEFRESCEVLLASARLLPVGAMCELFRRRPLSLLEQSQVLAELMRLPEEEVSNELFLALMERFGI